MSRKPTKKVTAAARLRELRKEGARILKLAQEGLAEFDAQMIGDKRGVVIDGRIVGDKIIVDPLARLAAARHMMSAMNAPPTTKSPKPLRLNQKAQLVPAAQFARWHEIASETAGLTELDHKVLDAIVEYYRQLAQRGSATFPSIGQMAQSTGAGSIDITSAIRNLVGLALIGVKPGAGARRNEYLMCLPKRIIAALSAAPADADVPPF